MLCSFNTAQAIPALKGIYRTITLADGRQIKVELKGNEYSHFWVDSLGNCYQQALGETYYQQKDVTVLSAQAFKKLHVANQLRARKLNNARKTSSSPEEKNTTLTGEKKCIIILVEFTDTKFTFGHNKTYYEKVANEINFSSDLGFVGSVKDYFLAQSNGQFSLDFDIVGPYTLKHECAYYGGNDDSGNDKRPGAMIAEACKAAEKDVDFSDYDWDGDRVVDQVFVLYAGKNEAAGGEENTIWPHQYYLSQSDYGTSYVPSNSNVTVDSYACSSELTAISSPLGLRYRVDGIGTICHEFSHCLGFPDLYDTTYSGNFGMGTFDLLSSGSYNGTGFCPPNFSAYEKWVAGWITPTELSEPTSVRGMKPQDLKYGEAYIIYNDSHKNEYYLLENRQQTGVWDSKLADSGLMIMHVDYNKDIWEGNYVNANVNYSGTYGEQYAYLDNDHERLTIFHADNETKDEAGDLYPYDTNNSLTDISTPSAILYNGSFTMNKPITNITQNEDGSIDFDFMGGSDTNVITGITAHKKDNTPSTEEIIYTLDGKRINGDTKSLPSNIYIIQQAARQRKIFVR